MADNSKTLSKLVIHSFQKNDFKEEDKSKLFITPINPEQHWLLLLIREFQLAFY